MTNSTRYQGLKLIRKSVALLLSGVIAISAPSHADSKNTYLSSNSNEDRSSFSDIYSPEMMAAYKGFQADADIIRLQQLKYWVDLIETYHDKTGHYPLQPSNDQTITVFIATPDQQRYTYQLPGSEYVDMTQFVDTLESGLGYTIVERYDPQYVPDAKPNYYIYMLDRGDYFFAIHTHQDYSFSRPVAPDYNKVEVSNHYSPYTPKILTSTMLFESPAYQEATTKPIQNPEFFAYREALTSQASKAK